MTEDLRAKYILWQIRLYMWITDKWHAHILKQQKTHWDRMDPDLRRQVEWRIKMGD